MPNPADPTTPADTDFVKGAAAELRALKHYLQNDGTYPPTLFALLAGAAGQQFAALNARTSGAGAAAKDVVNVSQFHLTQSGAELSITIPTDNGLFVLKLGMYLKNVGSEGADTIPFVSAFPNACFFAVLSGANPASANNLDLYPQFISATAALINVYYQSSTGGNTNSAGVMYAAIGN